MTDVSVRPPGAAPDELRERLLVAAAAVFARQGYDGTKIMDIVRESGLSTGAVYGRFRSKNDLLREAVVTRASTTASALGAEPVDRVAELISRAAVRTDEPLTDEEALRLEAFVTARREPEVADALAESAATWRASVAPLVEAARLDGTVAPDVDPEAVLFLVRLLSLGLLLHRGSGVPGPEPAGWGDLVERIVASFGASGAVSPEEAP